MFADCEQIFDCNGLSQNAANQLHYNHSVQPNINIKYAIILRLLLMPFKSY